MENSIVWILVLKWPGGCSYCVTSCSMWQYYCGSVSAHVWNSIFLSVWETRCRYRQDIPRAWQKEIGKKDTGFEFGKDRSEVGQSKMSGWKLKSPKFANQANQCRVGGDWGFQGCVLRVEVKKKALRCSLATVQGLKLRPLSPSQQPFGDLCNYSEWIHLERQVCKQDGRCFHSGKYSPRKCFFGEMVKQKSVTINLLFWVYVGALMQT